MLEQSVKLSRLIIFYFISNFLIYSPILPNREPKTSAFRSVFVFRAVFQLLYSCFGPKSKCVANANRFLLETGPERIQHLRHLDSGFDWLSVSSFVYQPIRMSRLLHFSALHYLFSSPCYLKTAFLLTNHNREIFSCILVNEKLSTDLFLLLRKCARNVRS